jgi:hypothetical protein
MEIKEFTNDQLDDIRSIPSRIFLMEHVLFAFLDGSIILISSHNLSGIFLIVGRCFLIHLNAIPIIPNPVALVTAI